MAQATTRAQYRAYGRARARRRIDSGQWAPHPGWRNRLEAGLAVLVDQVAALQRIDELVDAELWRTDKRTRWIAILRHLVYGMDWCTGLVCGLTRAQLAEVGGCSERTVSSVLAWAQAVGLLVVVECGAAAAFLGSSRNRAPTYVLVATISPVELVDCTAESTAARDLANGHHQPVEQSCNLPHSSVEEEPLSGGRRPASPRRQAADWPGWQVPASPAERNAAVSTVLRRIGLDRPSVPAWRARALLHMWWLDGVCVAGLLHMFDHHPDRPDQPRGDALRGARDPLRVLGHRLRPWIGRLDALPRHLVGRHGDYRAKQAARLARLIGSQEP